MPPSEEIVPSSLKSENEVDELQEDNDFSDDSDAEEDEECQIHDNPLQPPTVQMLTTKALHSTIRHEATHPCVLIPLCSVDLRRRHKS